MTRYEKITVSLSSRAAENARRAVRDGRASSVSAYVTEVLEEKGSREELIAMLDQMLEETGGPPTPAEIRAVDRALGFATNRPRKRKPKRRRR
jgi:hypothetical protein